MGGFDKNPQPTPAGKGGLMFPPGHILHDYLEARVMPGIIGPVTRGDLQYAAMWKAAQRMTKKPVKFGTIGPELVAFAVQDKHYKSIKDRILAITDALNAELTDLADAGCQVIQFEEPQIHMLAIRKVVDEVINPNFSVEVFNRTVKGLRAKTEVWCHTCWGNPSQQRMFKEVQSYKDALETLNKVDADVITFEIRQRRRHAIWRPSARSSLRTRRSPSASSTIIRCRSRSRRRSPTIIRRALKYIPAERLIISSDCGMGREGMSRRHAYYKIVSLVLGTNMVRKELGLAAGRMPGRRPALFAGGTERLTRSGSSLPKAERT